MGAAFFDRAGRGRLIVTGRDRKDLLHRLATNSVIDLEPGCGAPTCFLTRKGRMIDWCVILERGEDALILSQNPERLAGHILEYTITEDVTVRNYMAIELLVCGPDAAALLGVELEPWCFTERALAGVNVLVARVEPLMGDAYCLLAPDAVALRRMLAEHAEALDPYQVQELRVKARIPAFPNEINERHNPWEARLDGSISLTKGCYIGQEVIARLRTYDSVRRHLVRLKLDRTAESGDRLHKDGAEVGELTTVAGGEALGYVERAWAAPGTRLDEAEVLE